MTQAAKAHDSSMEEILASIRRIISDDEPAGAEPVSPAAALAAGMEDADDGPVGPDAPANDSAPTENGVELADATQPGAPIRAADPPAGAALREAAAPPGAVSGVERPATAAPGEKPRPTVGAPPVQERALLSPHSSAAVDMAFSSLAHTVLAQNSRTLEDLVREMLKPMLKAWLDDNLPNMVERLVRAEIERVSRGRG